MPRTTASARTSTPEPSPSRRPSPQSRSTSSATPIARNRSELDRAHCQQEQPQPLLRISHILGSPATARQHAGQRRTPSRCSSIGIVGYAFEAAAAGATIRLGSRWPSASAVVPADDHPWARTEPLTAQRSSASILLTPTAAAETLLSHGWPTDRERFDRNVLLGECRIPRKNQTTGRINRTTLSAYSRIVLKRQNTR